MSPLFMGGHRLLCEKGGAMGLNASLKDQFKGFIHMRKAPQLRKLGLVAAVLLMVTLSGCMDFRCGSTDWADDVRLDAEYGRKDFLKGMDESRFLEMKKNIREEEEQEDKAVGEEAKVPSADNVSKAMDFMNQAKKDADVSFTSPERIHQRAVTRYGEANVDAAFKVNNLKPPAPYPTARAIVTAQALKDADRYATAVPWETALARSQKEQELTEAKQTATAVAKEPTPTVNELLGQIDPKTGERVPLLYQDEPPSGEPVQVFKVGSDLAVQNGGTPTHFTIDKDYWVTEIWTYHYNNRKGAPAGTIAIQTADGKTTYGPWQAELNNGVYWVAKPNVWIPKGSYLVIDSDPSTFAQNAESGGQGMAWMYGKPAP